MHKDGRPSGGRPKGRQNDTTIEVQRFCQGVIRDPAYAENFVRRARDGRLGAMEPVMWAYAFGRPKEVMEPPHESQDLSNLTLEELQGMLDKMQRELGEAIEIQRLLPPVIDVEVVVKEKSDETSG